MSPTFADLELAIRGARRVDPKLYTEFDLNPGMELAAEVTEMLKDSGFDAAMDPKFEQIHDTL
jgi:hypothetical protein